MSEQDLGGVVTPAADATPPGGANPVPAPGAPAGQDNAQPQGEQPVQPRTYSEEEHKRLVAENVADRLKKERRRLERTLRAEVERDYLRQQMERGQPRQQANEPKGKPKKEDFETVDDYLDAVVDWRLEQRESERAKKSEASRGQRETQEQGRRLFEACLKGADDLGVEDFDQVALDEELDVTTPMMHAIAECKAPAAILYHLGQNPKEATRISKLAPTHQIRAIAEIESKLTAAPGPSKAPAPIVPSKPTGSPKDPYDGSDTAAHVKAYHARKR